MHSSQGRHSRQQHVFSLAPQVNIQRSSFNRSHGHKTVFNAGLLIPIFIDEVLPGDSFNLRLTALARMATPIFPIMDNLYFETHFFFVPNRLVWNHWEQFNGQQANPADTTDYIIPTLSSAATGFVTGSMADYFGIPTLTSAGALTVNALFFRAYNLIYNEWFRDENLQDSAVVELDDGPDTLANYAILRRGKRHDYFTSCLPWPQKINDGTVVEIPLGTSAPIIGDGNASHVPLWVNSGGTAAGIFTAKTSAAAPDVTTTNVAGSWTAGDLMHLATKAQELVPSGMIADLSTATAATINQLRQAFQLQVLFERDARGGTRYTEIIRSHFNVISPDARLQRPEYLGGGSQMISINPVTQNAPGDVGGSGEQISPQGTLSAFGVGHVHGHGFTKSFTEHGILMGFASVRADLNYMQGLNRMFTRSTRYDFYWPALAHIGEQAVLNQEIYAQGTATDLLVFGYQERYAEYRYKPSIVTNLFRANASGTLDAWHLAQAFGSLPALNSTFIVENPPMSRIEAVSNQADFICDMFFDLKCARPMPLYGDPLQLGRF
jgi:hypothetical protein